MAWRSKRIKGWRNQGSNFGIWEYLSQSNDNAECISENKQLKFVDDLSFLEIINLLSVGIAGYNVRADVPSDVPVHNQIIVPENIESQNQLSDTNIWTKNMKMKLNEKKTKSIIFNFSRKHQFITKLSVKNQNIEVVKETKLFVTILTDDQEQEYKRNKLG